MPLITFDILEGRSDADLKTLLDAVHAVVLEAFGVPDRDRYQIVREHKRGRMIVQDTGLGFQRSDNVVVVRVTTRPRSREDKLRFYSLLSERLQVACGIDPVDVVVSLTVNGDEDWSFGHGRAQFLSGEL